MKWSKEAEEALTRVPFFIRKRVRGRIEEETRRTGSTTVTLEHVRNAQRRFLEGMEQEVKGYQLETCFGTSDCPNRAVDCLGMIEELEDLISHRDLKSFLRERVEGPLKLHHELRISLSCCPNACSRPQIVDLGIIGAQRPRLSQEPCSRCGACIESCKEGALVLEEPMDQPSFDAEKCLYCGQCIRVCPSGTLTVDREGFRLLVGGKLGRHPQLGRDLGEIFSRKELLSRIQGFLDLYRAENQKGERLGDILNRLQRENRFLLPIPSGEG